jgi:thiol:disulfide interchange protein DsbD
LIAQQLTQANARIVVDSYWLEKSRSVPIGVLVELEEGWHIYWRNSGDTGIPTSIEFDLPEGINVSEIQWAVPKVFEYDGLASFGYDKQVLLLTELIIPGNYKSNSVSVIVKLKSLICKDVCIPFNITVSKEIMLMNNFPADDDVSTLFVEARKNLPEVKNDLELSITPDEDFLTLIIQSLNPDLTKINSLYFLPYDNGIFKNTAEQNYKVKDDGIELKLEYDHFKTEELRELFGILVFNLNDTAESQKVYEIKKQLNTNN